MGAEGPSHGWRSGPVARLLTEMEDGAALALCRIGVVAVLTVSLLSHVGAVATYFSDASPVANNWARHAFPSRWSLFFTVHEPNAVRAVFGVGVLAHLCWMLGAGTRLASALALVVWVSMMGRNPLLYGFPDQLGLVMGVLLACMPTGRCWSVDAWWRRRRGRRGANEGRVPVWCRHLLQLQLAFVYASTGFLKTGRTWREEGTAVYFTVNNPLNRHFEIAEWTAALQPWLLRPLTYGVLVWEIAFAGFVVVWWVRRWRGPGRWRPDLRWLFLGAGLSMHLGIQVLVYVVTFSALMVASYACFLEPHEARALVARVRGVLARGRGHTAAAGI